MTHYTKESREFSEQRICFACLRVIPPTKGIVNTGLGILTCQRDECRNAVKQAEKDYSRSPRGRRRPTWQAIRLIREQRPALAAVAESGQQ